jgi:hypothetical protein
MLMRDTRTSGKDTYTGVPWAICDRCGQRWRLNELRKEWSGLMVCPPDWDPLPDTMRPPRVIPEGLPVPNARPEPPDTFVTHNITPAEL